MNKIPRILPLAGVAIVGVIGVNALAGADSIPKLFAGATSAFAEGAPDKPVAKPDAKPPALQGGSAAVCAPTAAELAKEAGLSPSELQVLQSLGDRRGQLDAREQGFDLQLQLLAAAEAKLDAKFKSLEGLRSEIKTLLGQVDAQQEAEITRLVAVFSAMKAKDAAAQMRILDDSVRLPIASRMKERTLAAILSQMPPADAKQITEKLAVRFAQNAAVLAGKDAVKPEAPKGPVLPAAGPPGAAKPAGPVKAEAPKPELSGAKPPEKAG